jgi:hypothetical protein
MKTSQGKKIMFSEAEMRKLSQLVPKQVQILKKTPKGISQYRIVKEKYSQTDRLLTLYITDETIPYQT